MPSFDEEEFAKLVRQDESRLIFEMVREFSTLEPFDQALRKQLNLIGFFLKTWLRAEKALHFFSNPDGDIVHWMLIVNDQNKVPVKFNKEIICVEIFNSIEVIRGGNLKIFCEKELGPGLSYLLFPFSQHALPFGHFILSFHNEFTNDFVHNKIIGTLNLLQHHLKYLLYNHYPITRFTYLPYFNCPQTCEAAILFCDIRNSTKIFEIMRMAKKGKYIDMIVSLIKNFLEYASRIISVPYIGRIHRFMGDGFLSTFGEHLIGDPDTKAKASCALALLTGKLLVQGFDKLWSELEEHALYSEFAGTHCEGLDPRLGVGVNYGEIRFDFFGITEEYLPSESIRGYGEFMAIGDHVNVTDRLCSVASQPVNAINIIKRTKLFNSDLTAPIIASQTVIYQCRECFKREDDPMITFKSEFKHKGKGHPLPGYEFWPKCIDTYCLLNLLKNIHKNRFYDAMVGEVTKDIDKRPKLNEVTKKLMKDLDNINNPNET